MNAIVKQALSGWANLFSCRSIVAGAVHRGEPNRMIDRAWVCERVVTLILSLFPRAQPSCAPLSRQLRLPLSLSFSCFLDLKGSFRSLAPYPQTQHKHILCSGKRGQSPVDGPVSHQHPTNNKNDDAKYTPAHNHGPVQHGRTWRMEMRGCFLHTAHI